MSEQECEMSLKKTADGKVFKKRVKLKQFLNERSLIQDGLFQSYVNKDDGNKTELEKRKSRYKPLEFSKKKSNTTVKLYKDKQMSQSQSNHITIIPETDTDEVEGEETEILLLNQKKSWMTDLFQPKVLLTDIINLCSDSDNNS